MERELLLLGLLRRQEMHGYQLMEFVDRTLARCTDLKRPTAYFLLDKMAEAGWVARTESQAGNRPPRHVYRLTAQGEAEFQRLLRASLAGYTPARFADDIGLAFLDTLPSAEALRLLEQRRAALTAALDTARAVPPHPGSMQFIIDHQVRHLEAELEWLDELRARLPHSRKKTQRPLKSLPLAR
jgi:DNA-binding PadR family transcriptional regulator